MTNGNIDTAARTKLSVRTGASRKLLERKAAEKASDASSVGPALEDSFPTDAEVSAESIVAPVKDDQAPLTVLASTKLTEQITATPRTLPAPIQAAPAPAPAAAHAPPAQVTTWSAEDESAFQALSARRKAAGYQRRGKDVGAQVIRPGDITPNPNTVVAVIVGLVAEKGSIGRADLITAMGQVTFLHPKAQPTDHGWCQGYIAGAVRNGFLSVDVGQDAVAQAEEAA